MKFISYIFHIIITGFILSCSADVTVDQKGAEAASTETEEVEGVATGNNQTQGVFTSGPTSQAKINQS